MSSKHEQDKELTIGEKLKKLRTDKGISQDDLAKELYIAKTTISNIETGKYKTIDTENIVRYADYFHVSTDFILGRSGEYKDKSTEEIGKILGLSENSVLALMLLAGVDYNEALTNHYGKDLKCIEPSDRKDFSENLRVINLLLEELFNDIEISRKHKVRGKVSPFSKVLDNFFIPMYEYLFSLGINFQEYRDEDGNLLDRVCERVDFTDDTFQFIYNMRDEIDTASLFEYTDIKLLIKIFHKLKEYRKRHIETVKKQANKDKQNKFKEYCTEHGIKQTEIADILKLSVQTVNQKLNNKVSFTLDQVKTLCVHYGISADEYF